MSHADAMKEYIVVLITASSEEEAEAIARGILGARLAACVNMLNKVRSLYWWQGRIGEGKEVLMIVKTKRDLFRKLAEKVKSLHSYSVPEIIALPIIEGSGDYLAWLGEETE